MTNQIKDCAIIRQAPYSIVVPPACPIKLMMTVSEKGHTSFLGYLRWTRGGEMRLRKHELISEGKKEETAAAAAASSSHSVHEIRL